MRHPLFAIVDDDRQLCSLMASIAHAHGFQPRQLHSMAEATAWLASHAPDLALLDIGLPDGCGLDLLDLVSEKQRSRFVCLSGTGDSAQIRRAETGPARCLIAKPIGLDRFEQLLDECLQRPTFSNQNEPQDEDGLIGHSEAMHRLRQELAQVSPSDLNVLICGESGTGKELVAQAIHRRSGRQGDFIAINCGAIPHELLASQLFGHERGAFTGANARHVGFLEQARNGTLFLDEIGEMPKPLQVYLLRALESGRVVRLGGTYETPLDVRVLAATNRPPSSEFIRQELFYRVAHYIITLVPLRERGKDVEVLARHFLHRLQSGQDARERMLDQLGIASLYDYDWPGNVRELLAATRRALLAPAGQPLRIVPQLRAAGETAEEAVRFPIATPMQQVQDEMMRRVLSHHHGDRTATARSLGLSVRTVHNYLARMRDHE